MSGALQGLQDWAAELRELQKPLCIDLFCGLGGWTEGFLAENYRVVGFDIEIRPYPAQLVIQDVLTIHGSQFKDAAVIVASPPCQKYSYLAMPWSRSQDPNNSKAAKALRREWETNGPDNRLFDACFRIQREAIEATRKKCPCCTGTGSSSYLQPGTHGCGNCNGLGFIGERFIPLIVENVRGAQPWVGRSAWNYGSFHLWGDVPALMPINLKRGAKHDPRGYDSNGGSWFNVSMSDTRHGREGIRAEGRKGSTGLGGEAPAGVGNSSWFHGKRADPRDVRKQADGSWALVDGTKIGGDWLSDPQSTCRKHGSRSNARKMASAQIAKIPFELARHVAQVYYPRSLEQAVGGPRRMGKTEC